MSYSKTPPLPTSSIRRAPATSRVDRLADQPIGVERGDVAPVLVARRRTRRSSRRSRHPARSSGERTWRSPLACRACRSCSSEFDAYERHLPRGGRGLDRLRRRRPRPLHAGQGRAAASCRLGELGGPPDGSRLPRRRLRPRRDRSLPRGTGRAAWPGVDVVAGMVERGPRAQPVGRVPGIRARATRFRSTTASFDVASRSASFTTSRRGSGSAWSREMTRVCRPGGLIAIFEHNPLNPLTRRRSRAASSTVTRSCSRGARRAGCSRAPGSSPRRPLHRVLPPRLSGYCEGSSAVSAGCRSGPSTSSSRTGPEGPDVEALGAGDQVQRPVLALLVGAGDVEPDHAEDDQLHPGEEGDQHRQRGPALATGRQRRRRA